MLELAREVAARGALERFGARAAAARGAGAARSVSSNRLLPHPGLSHIDPIENRLLMGRFSTRNLGQPTSTSTSRRDIREVLISRA